MSHTDQITAFSRDIQSVVDRYAAEFNLPISTALGILEFTKLNLYTREMIDHRPPTNDRDFGDDPDE